VARFSPSRLVLVERSEPALYTIDRELREAWPSVPIVPVVGDVGEPERMLSVFREHRPQVVVHAAAHKHVPLMETNATEAVKNNVLGTIALGEAAGECGVEAFILVSTDKAVRPTSVMGATKRVAELVVRDLGRRFPTRYVAVRFGNVLGSAGSDAKRMIELSGHRRSGDVDIVFTGLRPGEKLFEELEYGDEATDRTRHPKIFIGKIAGVPAAELSGGAFFAEGAGVERLVGRGAGVPGGVPA
jgi:FlaA1/EpsC-like NDP-sugar epimerase